VIFLYENGWILFILSEALTWLAALIFFACRYLLRLERISNFCLLLIILCTIFQAFLAGVNYFFTGKVSFFQVVIILFIIYASTLGSSDFERIDKYLQQKFNKYRKLNSNEETPDSTTELNYRNGLFLFHTIAFSFMHLIWFCLDFLTMNYSFTHVFLFQQWISHPHQGIFHNSAFNIISYLWSIIYIFDLCFFIIFTFPYKIRKERK
jgi:hypothetical protein